MNEPSKKFYAVIEFKDPDLVSVLQEELGVSESTLCDHFRWHEYGSVELTIEGPDLKITEAKFLKVNR